MNDRHLYRFADLELLTDEHLLHRNGEAVPLTPKMYEMLSVLIRNHGQVVEKETLLKEVWPDSFVEEGNIAFNIRQLRKALNDDAQSPTFIETVPRRGYRFIAEVEEIDPTLEPDAPAESELSVVPAIAAAKAPSKWFVPSVAAIAILVFAVIAAGSWYWLGNGHGGGIALLSEPFASEKLSTTGLVYSAAISPDGQTVVYSVRNGPRQSLWLRQLPAATNLEIIPPVDGTYYELVFTPDGNSLYFSRQTDPATGRADIYRIPVHGGIPQKIVSGTEGWLSISHDAKLLSFVRCSHRDDDYCSLWVADAADGGHEKKLVTSQRPIRIADNEISPDGTKVAFAIGQSRNQGNEFRLMEVGIESLAEREITAEQFFNIRSLTWLPDQSGLLLTASRIPNKYFRIWRTSSTTGEVEPLTKDPETYSVLSLDSSGSRLVTTQIKQDFHAFSFNSDDPSKIRPLTDATAAAFASTGRLFYSSTMSGNDEIWSMNGDGSEQRQLTNDPADDRQPIPSADGKTVFFASNRTGQAHVWRMAADGSDQVQLTKTEGGSPLFAAPDGRSVYYRHDLSGTLWSVSLENGEEKAVITGLPFSFSFSPDGTLVATIEHPDDHPALLVASLLDGHSVAAFDLPGDRSRPPIAVWMPNARALMYLAADGEVGKYKVYRQELAGGPPRLIADLAGDETDEIAGLTVSPDGKNIVVVRGGWRHDAVLIKGLK